MNEVDKVALKFCVLFNYASIQEVHRLLQQVKNIDMNLIHIQMYDHKRIVNTLRRPLDVSSFVHRMTFEFPLVIKHRFISLMDT